MFLILKSIYYRHFIDLTRCLFVVVFLLLFFFLFFFLFCFFFVVVVVFFFLFFFFAVNIFMIKKQGRHMAPDKILSIKQEIFPFGIKRQEKNDFPKDVKEK